MIVYYNETFFNSNKLKDVVPFYTAALPNNVTFLMSMGYSGCSIASAMLFNSKRDLKHIAIRKSLINEHSPIGGCYPDSSDVICIVDDVIQSGQTIINIFQGTPIEITDNVKYILIGRKLGNAWDKVAKDFSLEKIKLIEIFNE